MARRTKRTSSLSLDNFRGQPVPGGRMYKFTHGGFELSGFRPDGASGVVFIAAYQWTRRNGETRKVPIVRVSRGTRDIVAAAVAAFERLEELGLIVEPEVTRGEGTLELDGEVIEL